MVACGLACASSARAMAEQARAHGVAHTACADDTPDLGELMDASEPDIVLNAIVGAAGLRWTLAALDRGLPVALANKESLVVGGELVSAARDRAGAALVPVDSEHSALLQLLEGVPRERVVAGMLTASGGPFRGTGGRGARVGHAGAGPAPPHVGDGGPHHDRLGDAHEQGLRGDRGPSPLRAALRPDRGRRPPAVPRARDGAARRRERPRPLRPARHAGADRLRPPPPRPAPAGGADGPGGPPARLRGARRGRLPLPRPGARGRPRGWDGARGAQRGRRGGGGGLPRGAHRVHGHRARRAAALEAVPAAPADTLEGVLDADARSREAARAAIEGVPAWSA